MTGVYTLKLYIRNLLRLGCGFVALLARDEDKQTKPTRAAGLSSFEGEVFLWDLALPARISGTSAGLLVRGLAAVIKITD